MAMVDVRRDPDFAGAAGGAGVASPPVPGVPYAPKTLVPVVLPPVSPGRAVCAPVPDAAPAWW